jgi:2-methylisocitrate lyase-like PEP mutase family enzyme
MDDRTTRFRTLHRAGTFVMPNPHDPGSARLLAALGFEALATTSGGFAASLGRADMSVTRDELVGHVGSVCEATDLPVNVDAERCFPESPGGVAETVARLAAAGAAGCSIEDWDPGAGSIEEVETAVDRVREAAKAAEASGLVLTARAENHLRGRDDLDDTIARLAAYAAAGADVVYAPGLTDLAAFGRIVEEAGAPVNVLLLPGGPSVGDLTAAGVRRISIGSSLARVAYGALVQAAEELLSSGSLPLGLPYLSRSLATEAFSPPPVGR